MDMFKIYSTQTLAMTLYRAVTSAHQSKTSTEDKGVPSMGYRQQKKWLHFDGKHHMYGWLSKKRYTKSHIPKYEC